MDDQLQPSFSVQRIRTCLTVRVHDLNARFESMLIQSRSLIVKPRKSLSDDIACQPIGIKGIDAERSELLECRTFASGNSACESVDRCSQIDLPLLKNDF